MTLFTDLVKGLSAIYATGATAHTILELALLALKFQNSFNRVLAEELSAATTLTEYLRAFAEIWLPVYAYPPEIALPVVFGNFILGIIILAFTGRFLLGNRL